MAQALSELVETVDALVAELAGDRAPLLPLLHALQERWGCVDPASIALIARALNLSRADVHGVVSFYKDFLTEQPGAVVARICRAEACASMGAETLVLLLEEALSVELGATSSDGGITFDEVFCLGNCALGPAVQVNGRVIGRADPAHVLDAIARSVG